MFRLCVSDETGLDYFGARYFSEAENLAYAGLRCNARKGSDIGLSLSQSFTCGEPLVDRLGNGRYRRMIAVRNQVCEARLPKTR
jgi:hypothetical protein